MKNWLCTATFGLPLVLAGLYGCTSSPDHIIHNSTAGASGSTAGATGTAGASGSGSGESGTTGASGDVGTGGVTGTAGSEAGATGTAGMGTGTGGAMGGSGGAGGATGTGGMGGAVSGALCTPSGAQFDCNNVLSGMDGYANIDNASGPSQGSDAIQLNCTPSDMAGQQTIFKQKHWQLMGAGITMGKMYKVDLHFYGVVECKTYVGGTGPAKSDPNFSAPNVSQTHNLWLQGSTDNGDHWNTYAFSITPMTNAHLMGIGPQGGGAVFPDPANVYVINECPGSHGEGHFTWNIDFAASINVPGGSFINYIEYDTNCRMIANCGAADSAQSCNGPYNVVNTVMNAVPNTMAPPIQPIANTANPPSRGQWWLVDVTNVTAM